MALSNLEKYVADITKEIVVAKLSTSSPVHDDEKVGKSIGEMYLAIYNTILDGFKAD